MKVFYKIQKKQTKNKPKNSQKKKKKLFFLKKNLYSYHMLLYLEPQSLEPQIEPRQTSEMLLTKPFLVDIIANILEDLTTETSNLNFHQKCRFNCKTPPKISIRKYLQRIKNYCRHCSEECFILAMIYIDRITEYNPQFIITKFNIHR